MTSDVIIKKIKVSDKNWYEFILTLDSIDIWNWDSEYLNPGVLDGFYWSLKAETSERSVSSRGENNYPGTPDEYDEYPIYARLHLAIDKLIAEGQTID